MTTKDSESPTRTKLLDAAEEVMLARGYVAATVDGICTAAGLTKGSFFHYFRGKEELGKVVLLRFAERQGATFTEACSAIEDPLDRIYCIIDCAVEGSCCPDMKGCLVGTFAQEISNTHPELREICQACFDGFGQSLAADLEAAKQLYKPDADFDAASLGRYFISIAQGSMLLMRLSGDSVTMKDNLIHFRAYLRSLFGR